MQDLLTVRSSVGSATTKDYVLRILSARVLELHNPIISKIITVISPNIAIGIITGNRNTNSGSL